MVRRIHSADRFDGGLNTKAQPFQLSPTQTPDALNVYADDYGAITSRLGYKYLNNSGITLGGSAATILDIYNFKRDSGTDDLIAFAIARHF